MGETCDMTLANHAEETLWLAVAEAGEGDGEEDDLLVHSAQIDNGSSPGWVAWPRDRVDEYFPWLRPFWRRRWTPGDFISLTFVFLVIAMTSLILFGMIKVLLNPDKYTAPTLPDCARSPTSLPPYVDLSILSQVSIFVGVMSTGTEVGFRRRDAIRSTWAKQNGGMNRTVVKFIIGQGAGKELEMENELYGDIVMLPPKQTYFSWAYEHALVPDLTGEWVRPEYVVQTGDKSVVDLLELEARLRVEWYVARGEDRGSGSGPLIYSRDSSMYALSWSVVSYVAEHGMNGRYQVEDWIKRHPHASRIWWRDERCKIQVLKPKFDMPASKSHGPHSYREIERTPRHPRCERHETNKVSKRTKQNCTRRINLEERDQLTARELERASRPNHTSKEPKSLLQAEPHGSASTSTAAPLTSTSAAAPLASVSNVTPSIRRLNPREQMLAIVAYQLASPAGRKELKARVATLARSWGAPSNGKCLNLEGSGAGNQDVNLQKAVPGHDAVLELDSTDMGSEADVETYHEMQLDELGS